MGCMQGKKSKPVSGDQGPSSSNWLCKENTFCITKASQERYFHGEQKVGRSRVKGFPLMNSRFEKAGRIFLRGSGLERGRLVTKEDMKGRCEFGLWENQTSWSMEKSTVRRRSENLFSLIESFCVNLCSSFEFH